MPKTALCVVGWHLSHSIYSDIRQLRSLDHIFVASHRKLDMRFKLQHSRIRFYEFENVGYDWGAYQQWLNLNLWQPYEFVFFMHDDVIIKSLQLIHDCVRLFETRPVCVLGNGRNGGGKQDWPRTHASYYNHSTWKPPDKFKHLTVRGSFFGVRTSLLKAIDGQFEVNWKPGIKNANTSLVATCGKMAAHCDNEFDYLSGQYMESQWLRELYRGHLTYVPRPKDRSD